MTDRFETFMLAITRLNRLVQRIKTTEMTDLGLKGSHTMILYYLGKNREGLTSAELTQCCNEDKAAISRALSELHTLELVRTASGSGRRGYREKIYLTDKGADAAGFIICRTNELLDLGGAGLTDAQRDGFYRALEIISENLGDIPEAGIREQWGDRTDD